MPDSEKMSIFTLPGLGLGANKFWNVMVTVIPVVIKNSYKESSEKTGGTENQRKSCVSSRW